MNPNDDSREPEHTSAAADDWARLGDLVALATERISTPVEGVHRAIAGRWVGLLTPAGSRVRPLTQSAIGGVYATVRSAGTLIGGALGSGASRAAKRNTLRPLSRMGRGGTIQAVANAVWGDELDHRGSALSIEMELCSPAGDSIPMEPLALAQTYPDALSRLVVLVHGWSETEQVWNKVPDDDSAAGLATTLESDGRTVLLVRYNTGLHVSTNGLALASLVESLVESWPVPVCQVDLVGHSMGGLVARSAVIAGRDAGHRWAEAAEHLVTLGTPHLGSPIEKGLALLSSSLRIVPESEPIGDFLDLRSSGIKDLRFGAVTQRDRLEPDPDHSSDRPAASADDHTTRHFAAGAVTKDPTHPLGKVLGDLVVRPSSGIGRGRRREVAATNVRLFGGRRHSNLLADPEVHAQVHDWLS